MNPISRRKFLAAGAVAGAAGIGAAASMAKRYGLVPPDGTGVWGPGETLSYAAQRLFSPHSSAREFSRGMISKTPFANEMSPLTAEFKALQAGGFADWKLSVNGLVAHPTVFSLADLRHLPQGRHVTELACEEGWSYIAEWIGTPLGAVLKECGMSPQARYVVYASSDSDWWDSIDLLDAYHPQTLLTYGMNDGDLTVPFGGPLRMRVPKQLGYKSVKFINRITVTDSLLKIGKGVGSASAEGGYAWYVGI